MCNQARLIRLLTAEDEGEGGSYSTLPTVPASQGWHGRELAWLALGGAPHSGWGVGLGGAHGPRRSFSTDTGLGTKLRC